MQFSVFALLLIMVLRRQIYEPFEAFFWQSGSYVYFLVALERSLNHCKCVCVFATRSRLVIFYKLLRLAEDCWYSAGFLAEASLFMTGTLTFVSKP